VNRLAVAVVLAALVCACGTQDAVTPSTSTGVTASPASSATALPSPSDEASPTPSEAAISLERVFKVDGAELSSIVAVPGGFLAGGCRLLTSADGSVTCKGALLLRSPDGRSWQEIALPGADGRRITTVAPTPFGLLALGATVTTEPPALRVAWRSVDGTAWEPFLMPALETIVFEQVVVLPDRTVFFGADYQYDLTVSDIAWATVDGVTSWTSGSTPITGKIAADPGLVAAGSECVDVCDTEMLSVHRSNDGFDWTEEQIPGALVATDLRVLSARDGRALLGGALGPRESPGAVLWYDDETLGWRPTNLVGGEGFAVVSVLVIDNRELVIGRSDADGATKAWLSTDHETYTPIEVSWSRDPYVRAAVGEGPLVLLVDDSEFWFASF